MNALRLSMDAIVNPLLGVSPGRKNLLAMEYGWLSALAALALAFGVTLMSFQNSPTTL